VAYVTIRRLPRPRADWWEQDEQPVLSREVMVADDTPAPTGLVDQNGTPIYRTPDRIRMGFATD
jgi:hypothetical protein